MDQVPVLLHCYGSWTDDFKFIRYKVTGVAISSSLSFVDFKKVLFESLGVDDRLEDLKIEFQASFVNPAMEINSDIFFQFFMSCKAQSVKLTDYPSLITKNPIGPAVVEGCETEPLHDLGIVEVDERDNHMDVDVSPSSSNVLQDSYNEHDLYIENVTNIAMSGMNFLVDQDSIEDDVEISESTLDCVKKSCERQYYLNCIDPKCSWFFRSSKRKNNGSFVVRKYCGDHTCNINLRNSGKRQATRTIIAKYIKNKYLSEKTTYIPLDIVNDVRNRLGTDINYQKAWRAKEEALKLIRGSAFESYNTLPSMMYMIRETNPSSILNIVMDGSRFKYFFMALHACIQGRKHCRPVVVVDATFLKTCYNSTLLCACAYDAAEMIFPLAFAIVDGENDESWEWFFHQFRVAFGDRPDLVVVSDRHPSIEKGCNKVLPGVMHGICTYHLLQNLKSKYRSNTEEMSKIFKRAAYSYKTSHFEKNMALLAEINEGIPSFLIGVDVAKWSMTHSITNRHSAMTSNNVESLNSMTTAAKSLPISSLISFLRNMLQKLFKTNRDITRNTKTELTKRYHKRIVKKYDLAAKMEVLPSTNHLVLVRRNGFEYVVDMQARTCTYNRFQVDEIPCAHALAYIRKNRLNSIDYCSVYFTKQKMVQTYAETVYPMPSRDHWDVPQDILDQLILPPNTAGRVGRLRKQRIRAAWESRRNFSVRCSSCGVSGHNRRTCPRAK